MQKSWVGTGGVLYSAIGATGPGNFTLRIINNATGPITWATGPTGFVWPGGAVPTLSTAIGSVDLVNVYNNGLQNYANAGSNYK